MTTETETELQMPAVHINGTGRSGLQSQIESIVMELTSAMELMRQGAPHARDYYVLGDGAFERARKQHEERLKRVQDVMDEYVQIYESIS